MAGDTGSTPARMPWWSNKLWDANDEVKLDFEQKNQVGDVSLELRSAVYHSAALKKPISTSSL